jgi:hypothetical protein
MPCKAMAHSTKSRNADLRRSPLLICKWCRSVSYIRKCNAREPDIPVRELRHASDSGLDKFDSNFRHCEAKDVGELTGEILVDQMRMLHCVYGSGSMFDMTRKRLNPCTQKTCLHSCGRGCRGGMIVDQMRVLHCVICSGSTFDMTGKRSNPCTQRCACILVD